MADIETKRISELIAAQDIGDTDLFVIEQGGAAKKALGSVVKGSIGGSSLPDGGSNGQVLTKTSSGAEWSDAGTPTQAQTDSAVADWLDAHPEATTTVQDGSITEQKLDPYLTAKVNGGGISNAVKVALLALLEKVAYVDEDGQTYLDALENALYPPANLVSITAVFNQGENTIYDTDSIDTLKQYLTVTANYSDGTTETVTNYTLIGTLTPGTSTIEVSYGGKTAAFDVFVSEVTYLEFVDGAVNSSLANSTTTQRNGTTYSVDWNEDYTGTKNWQNCRIYLQFPVVAGKTYKINLHSSKDYYIFETDQNGVVDNPGTLSGGLRQGSADATFTATKTGSQIRLAFNTPPATMDNPSIEEVAE